MKISAIKGGGRGEGVVRPDALWEMPLQISIFFFEPFPNYYKSMCQVQSKCIHDTNKSSTKKYPLWWRYQRPIYC